MLGDTGENKLDTNEKAVKSDSKSGDGMGSPMVTRRPANSSRVAYPKTMTSPKVGGDPKAGDPKAGDLEGPARPQNGDPKNSDPKNGKPQGGDGKSQAPVRRGLPLGCVRW